MEVKANNFYFECEHCKVIRAGFIKSQIIDFDKYTITMVYSCSVCKQPSVVTSKFPDKG